MTGMTTSQLRNRETGKPGNAGRFDGHTHAADTITLDDLTTEQFNEMFSSDFESHRNDVIVPSAIVVDGDDITIREAGKETNRDGETTTFVATSPDDEVDVTVYDWNIGNAEASIRAAVLSRRVNRLTAQKRLFPSEAHAAVDKEIQRLEDLQPLIGADWGYGEEITLAANVQDTVLSREDNEYLVPLGAENLHVTEGNITYGRHLDSDFLAHLVVGEREPLDEDEEQTARYWGLYENRMTRDSIAQVEKHFRDTYGLDFEDSFEHGSPLMVRRYVPTVQDGRQVTLEYAKDQVEDGFRQLEWDLDSGLLQEELADMIAYDRESEND